MTDTPDAGRSSARAAFLTDVLITAVEGGIDYWAHVRDYRHNLPVLDDTALADASATIIDTHTGTEHTITVDDIDRALTVIRGAGAPGWHPESISRRLVRAGDRGNDAGDIDADAADNIVQVALFGEPVYG